jgi:hypothetical protein
MEPSTVPETLVVRRAVWGFQEHPSTGAGRDQLESTRLSARKPEGNNAVGGAILHYFLGV